jgi:hypothetical protein
MKLIINERGDLQRFTRESDGSFKVMATLTGWDSGLRWISTSVDTHALDKALDNNFTEFVNLTDQHIVAWSRAIPDTALAVVKSFPNPYFMLRHAALGKEAFELFIDAPLLFWLLVSYKKRNAFGHAWFMSTVVRKRGDILETICEQKIQKRKSAIRFLNRFLSSDLHVLSQVVDSKVFHISLIRESTS